MIQGHTAGARDRKLCAVAATGVSSCHEPINLDDAIERLRLGYWTMLREGSLRQDLEATLKPLLANGVDLRRLILVTDSMTPDDVAERGHMDNVVRRAIALGLSPLQAIQMVTLNPAVYAGVEQDIGGIAPGRYADLALIDDLEPCHVDRVFVGGKVVARNGASLVDENPVAVPGDFFHSLSIARNASVQTFTIPCLAPRTKIRVMELLNQTITAERIMELSTPRGCVEADLENDLLKIAMFDRHRDAPVAFGFLKGFGVRVGAVGLTANLDENTLMIVGSDDADMALCANALVECGGGIAVCDRGHILEKLDLPGGGIFSFEPWREVGRQLRRLQQCLREHGSNFDKPICPLIFLPFVTLPALRITARGLVNAKERRVVSLFAD
jgi:adenine deaminase